MKSILERLISALWQSRYVVWFVILLMMGWGWWTTPPVQFNQTIEGFFPPDNPALKSYQRSERMFGGDQIVFVVYDDPKLWSPAGMQRLSSLTESIQESVPGISRVESLDRMPVPWRVDAAVAELAAEGFSVKGLVRMMKARANVEMVVRHTEDEPERQAELRKRLCGHPLFNGFVVDETGESTAVIVRLDKAEKIKQRETIAELRKVADEFAAEHGFANIAVAGPPVLIVDGFVSLEQDNRTLGWVAMLLMAIVMFIAVRNPIWAALPLVAGWTTWELAKYFITTYDLELTLSSGPIVAQTVVLCMPATSHLAVRFHDLLRKGVSREDAGRSVLLELFAPIAWCSLAAAGGYFASGTATQVRPMLQFGLVMFVCNLIAGFLAYCLAPGSMSLHFGTHERQQGRATSRVSEPVGTLTAWVIAHPFWTIALFALPTILIALGAPKLEFESNYINVFKPYSRTAEDYRSVESRMGGIGLAEVDFPAPDKLTPEWLEKVDQTAQQIARANPELVTQVVSMADLLLPTRGSEEQMPRPDVPPQRLLDERLEILTGPNYVNLLDNFWDPETGMTRILVRIRENAPADQKEACFQNMRELASERHSEKAFVTGLSHLMTRITRSVIQTATQSATWASLLVLLLLTIAFRNPLLAIVAFLPTLLAVGLVLGVMGWAGIKIDMSTAFVASIAIGLSVDDAIHCILNWKSQLAKGLTPIEALRVAYAGSGPGVVLSSAAVSLGFMVMLFSEFVPMFNFGWLIAIATLGGSFGNLVVVPAILVVIYASQRRKKPAN